MYRSSLCELCLGPSRSGSTFAKPLKSVRPFRVSLSKKKDKTHSISFLLHTLPHPPPLHQSSLASILPCFHPSFPLQLPSLFTGCHSQSTRSTNIARLSNDSCVHHGANLDNQIQDACSPRIKGKSATKTNRMLSMVQPLTTNRKFGSEFLCKTRYRNTLPLPPFAPKLLALPSSSDRYIKYQSTGLTETTANELILDNQWAMPIDLIEMHENYFGEGRQSNRRGLDQTDEHLLSVPLRAGAPGVNGTTTGTTGMLSRSRTPAVSWLRRTEYISSETPTGAGKGAGKE